MCQMFLQGPRSVLRVDNGEVISDFVQGMQGRIGGQRPY